MFIRQLIFISVILFLPNILYGQSKVYTLFSADKSQHANKTKSISSQYILLQNEFEKDDIEKLSIGDFIAIPLNDEPLTFQILSINQYTPNTLSFSATRPGGSSLSLTYIGNKVSGLLHHYQDNSTEDYILKNDLRRDGYSIISKKTTTNNDHLGCYHGVISSAAKDNILNKWKYSDRKKANNDISINNIRSNINSMTSVLESIITIDVMMPYTKAAREWAEQCDSEEGCQGTETIETYVAQIMNMSNQVLHNSNLPLRFRLVHYYELDYDETSDGLGQRCSDEGCPSATRLDRLTDTTDVYMNEVHELRDQYGADVVAALMSISDVGGIGWVLNTPSGISENAFSINRIQQSTSTYTVAHEIGHNLGNVHSRNQNQGTASIFGGLFTYSTGYRWMPADTGYTTVMGYSEGYQEIPMYSSPDLRWNGFSAGTLDDPLNGHTDAARSINNIKYAVASYRPTKVEPPVPFYSLNSSSENELSINLNREDQDSVYITVSNSGASDLVWELNVDLKSVDQLLTKSEIQQNKVNAIPLSDNIPLTWRDKESAPLFNKKYSQSDITFSKELSSDFKNQIIYEESFEDVPRTTYEVLKGWRTNNTSNEIFISGRNPSDGFQSMRLFTPNSDPFMWARSPYFGPMTTGIFELTMDIRVNSDVQTGFFNRFDLYVYDGKTDDLSSGVILLDYNDGEKDGRIYTYDLNPENPEEAVFYSTPFEVVLDEYRELKIIYDATNHRIRYYYGGELISVNQYTSGTSPDYFYFYLSRGDSESSTYNIDNIKLKRGPILDWLDIPKFAGTVQPGQTDYIKLDVNTYNIPAGAYSTTISITDNLGQEPVKVPLTLNVNSTVSAEEESIVPQTFNLRQNYPNPFNPSTAISYSLQRQTKVTLSIYDILGRSVSTLVDQYQQQGEYQVMFNAGNLPTGIYLYRLNTEYGSITKKMMLLK